MAATDKYRFRGRSRDRHIRTETALIALLGYLRSLDAVESLKFCSSVTGLAQQRVIVLGACDRAISGAPWMIVGDSEPPAGSIVLL